MFRAEVKVHSRQGRSGQRRDFAAVIAYRIGGKVVSPNGRVWDYTRKGAVVSTVTKGFADAQAFCDAVESAEKRKDSQLAREAVLSVDRRLDPAAARRCLAIWAEANLDRHRLPWTAALHSPKSLDRQRNPHFHVVWSDRPVEGNALGLKRRLTPTERTDQLSLMRASWAALQNAELEAAGHEPDLTHMRATVAEKGAAEAKMGRALGEVRRKGLDGASPHAVATVTGVHDLRRERKRKRRREARKRPQEAITVTTPPPFPDEPLVDAPASTPSEVPAPAVPILAQENVADAPSRGAPLRPSVGESGSPPSDHADPGRRGPQRAPLRTAIAAYKSADTSTERAKWIREVLLTAMRRYRRLRNAAETVIRALGATKHTQLIERNRKNRPERGRD